MEIQRSIFIRFVLLLLCFGSVKSSGDGDEITYSGNGDDTTTVTSVMTTTEDNTTTTVTPMMTTTEEITYSGNGDDTTVVTPMMTTTEANINYNTTVEVEISESLTEGKMVFYCNFNPSTESLWYKVNWYKDDSLIKTGKSLNTNIREETKLLETDLPDKTVGFQIGCGYQVALFEDSPYSSVTKSPQKFVGIKILSNAFVSDGGKGYITLQATAPIGCKSGETCSLGINIYNQDYSSSCYQPTPTFSECQIQLKADEWNKPFNLSVAAGMAYRYGTRSSINTVKLQTQSGFASHTMWEDYNLGTAQVSVTQSTYQTQGKSCYAVCDPHMKTFEYDHYEHQYLGTYTLYENKEWKQEIQIKTENCFPWRDSRPYCVCGLAVRAGKEVFVMDKCSPRKYWRIRHEQCDPTRSGLIDIVRRGSQYRITLPSGTVVSTNLYTYYKFMNLYMYPAEGDINNAEGLCGRVGERGFFHRDGTEERYFNWYGMYDFSESWSVKDDVLDLFSENDREKLEPIGNSVFQCKCARDPSGQSQVVCDRVDLSDCTFYFGRVRKVDDCKLRVTTSRKKRSIQKAVKQTKQEILDEPHTIEKRAADDGYAGNWTEATATAYCENLFYNSSAVQACENVPGVDLESPKNNCITDIKLGGETSFALTAVETIKNKCFKEVGQNSTLQNSTDGSPSILDTIQSVSCPFECSGKGSCQNGTCICDENFASDDCSIDLTKMPLGLVEYDDGEGECDADSCTAISINGGPFIEGGSAKCRVISKTLMTDGSLVVKSNETKDATIISIGEVSCPVTSSSRRRKRATGDPEMEEITVYEVSVSNGGAYSDSNQIVARHADCHDCNINATFVSCSYTGCYSEGKCYQKDDPLARDPCYICDIPGGKPVWIRSTSDGNCTVTNTPQEEGDQLWIIGAVLGAVVLMIIIVLIVVIVAKKKNKRPVTPILVGN